MAKREGIESTKSKIKAEALRQLARAAEIFQEEANEVVAEMHQNSQWTGGLQDASVEVTKFVRRRGGKDKLFNMSVTVTITDDVYNILDEGVHQVPRRAVDYGLKAFPMAYPRSLKGNSWKPPERKKKYKTKGAKKRRIDLADEGHEHMTAPDSIVFQPAKPLDDTIFRPIIYTPIPARNFTEQITEAARTRIAEEGLQVKFRVKKDKGDYDGE